MKDNKEDLENLCKDLETLKTSLDDAGVEKSARDLVRRLSKTSEYMGFFPNSLGLSHVLIKSLNTDP